MESTDIGKRIRSRRRELGWTQEEAARKADVPLNSLARIERGEVRDPHLSMLRRIATALSLSVAEVLGEEPLIVGKAGAPGMGQYMPRDSRPLEERVKELASLPFADVARIAKEMSPEELVETAAFLQGLWQVVREGDVPEENVRERYGNYAGALFVLQARLALHDMAWARGRKVDLSQLSEASREEAKRAVELVTNG